jgi:GcrA cell cycle regulator
MASPSEKPGETWTADRLARLAQLWTAGETAQAIADRLGVSRSAVMGKLFRLQLGRRKRASKASENRGEKRGKKRGKSLLELENGDCRWPIGDPGSDKFHFCGEPGADVEQDIPYCAHHMKRAYVGTPPKKTGGLGSRGGWHTISSGILGERSDDVLRTAIGERSDAVLRTATGERSDAVLRTAMARVRRLFRDAIARKERT